MNDPRLYFFIGKGGVGKSTTSALTAVHLAASGKRTLLVSMDPAHNQCDLFDTCFAEKPRRVTDNLTVREIDADHWMKRYLKQTREEIQRTYAYQSAFNLQDHFKILQYAPGLEEYALLLAFENVLTQADKHDAVVFDMAPTALSLRFFSLPSVTLIWLEQLLNLRTTICDKKEIISRIKLGSKEIETDKVRSKLEQLIDSNTRLKTVFQSEDTYIHLVLNNDRLSLAEAVRIHGRLADIDMTVAGIVVNKLDSLADLEAVSDRFPEDQLTHLPLIPGGILGLEALQQVAGEYKEAFGLLTRKSSS